MNRLLALLVTLPLAMAAMAQDHGTARKFRFQGSDGGSMVQMSLRSDVASELLLTEIQKVKLEQLEAGMQAAVSKAMLGAGDDPSSMRELIGGVGDKFAENLKTVLTPRQLGRLREILFQKNGYGSLLRKDVQTELALDDWERKGIAQSESDMLTKFDQFRTGSLEPEQMRAAVAKAISDRNLAIENLLTPRQKALFHRMKGKPFVFEDPK
jgi:hypothetical protein